MEFRPLPGQEEGWAGFQYVEISPLWRWLGVYPISLYLCFVLILFGMVASE